MQLSKIQTLCLSVMAATSLTLPGMVAAGQVIGDGNSSGGGTQDGFGEVFKGSYQGLTVQMQMFSKPQDMSANWANANAVDPRGLSRWLPDHGSVRELPGNGPEFPGRVGKWSGIFVNANATGLEDAQIVLRPVRFPNGGTGLIVGKLDGHSVIQKIACSCESAIPGNPANYYQIAIGVTHLFGDKSFVQNLVAGHYGSETECNARLPIDQAKICGGN